MPRGAFHSRNFLEGAGGGVDDEAAHGYIGGDERMGLDGVHGAAN